MLHPTSQGPMLSDSPKTAKIMPINNPSSQNWTGTNTGGVRNLESNGVSVTIVSGSGVPATESVRGLINNSVTITPANVSNANGTELERRQFATSGLTDGMAKCEHCGKRGVRDAFFTKKRNFCSNACVRAASKSSDNVEHSKLQGPPATKYLKPDTVAVADFEQEESSRGSSVHEGNRSTSSASNPYSDQDVIPIKRNKLDIDQSYDWSRMLNDPNFIAAKVASFKHAPVSSLWENVTVGMKVEVENTDVISNMSYQTAFWVASVIKIQGYKVLLRFEGFGHDSSRDFWVNLCSEDVHHVGWCATKGKPLIPPRSISGKFNDWREFLVKRLTGARTLPQNFQTKVASGLKSKFSLGTQLEVVDKNRICQLRLATVQKIVGKRLHLSYIDAEDGGFWCHEESPLIHPVGWARTVGHDIVAPKSYHPDILPRSAFKFPINYENVDLKEGMKLEAIDPLNLSAFCAATIKKVLKMGYIMIRVDCYEEESNCGSDWFCYHVTSPYIFQCGFAASNGLVLTPPHGYSKDSFKWDNYLHATSARAAPLSSLKKEPFEHDLEVNFRLEAADLMDPRLICVATISQVVGRLLKIHFDGWEEEYDQWLDAGSPDIYPVGWCELVGHKLEPPRPPVTMIPQNKKGGKKGRGKKTTTTIRPQAKIMTTKIGTKSSPRVSSGRNSAQLNESGLSISSAPVPRVAPTISPEAETVKTVEKKVQEDTVNMQKKTDEREMGLPMPPIIPRLIGSPSVSEMDEVDPQLWKVNHVKEFLEINECGAYCDSFNVRKVDGPKLMSLTKDQIILMTGMRVGPAVKILDLISQLKRLVQAARVRSK